MGSRLRLSVGFGSLAPASCAAVAMKSVVADPSRFDWEGDQPLKTPFSRTAIYELHVRSFTRHPSSGVAHPGTFRGLVEKIPYLVELGVTAVELPLLVVLTPTFTLTDWIYVLQNLLVLGIALTRRPPELPRDDQG